MPMGWLLPGRSTNARGAVVDIKHEARRYRDLRANRLSPSSPQGGAKTPEVSGGRGIGLVELDVSAPGARAAQ